MQTNTHGGGLRALLNQGSSMVTSGGKKINTGTVTTGIRGYSDLELAAGTAMVPGPNVNRDVVPAMLTPGEAVLNKGAAQEMGRSKIAALNQKHAKGKKAKVKGGRLHAIVGEEDVQNRSKLDVFTEGVKSFLFNPNRTAATARDPLENKVASPTEKPPVREVAGVVAPAPAPATASPVPAPVPAPATTSAKDQGPMGPNLPTPTVSNGITIQQYGSGLKSLSGTGKPGGDGWEQTDDYKRAILFNENQKRDKAMKDAAWGETMARVAANPDLFNDRMALYNANLGRLQLGIDKDGKQNAQPSQLEQLAKMNEMQQKQVAGKQALDSAAQMASLQKQILETTDPQQKAELSAMYQIMSGQQPSVFKQGTRVKDAMGEETVTPGMSALTGKPLGGQGITPTKGMVRTHTATGRKEVFDGKNWVAG
jgi:hypothetical protein